MKRRTLLCLLVLAIADAVAAESSGISYIAALNGKYPWEGVTEKQPSFFQTQLIKNQLVQLVPSAIRASISRELTTGTPNRVVDGFLLVSGCKPHSCPSKNYIVVVDLVSGHATFIIYDDSAGRDDEFSTFCFSKAVSPETLLASVKEEILQMHIARVHTADQLLPSNKWLNRLPCRAEGSNKPLQRTRSEKRASER